MSTQSGLAAEQRATPYPSAGRAWGLVGFLYLAYMLSFIDRQIVAYLVAPIRQALDITDVQVSLIAGVAFTIFYVLLGIPLGWLADRVSRVGIVSVCIALWSVMTAACGYAGNFWQLFAARVGVGIGEGSVTPSGVSLISDSFPRERRHLPINIFSAGVHGGLGISNIVGGLVVSAMGSEGARGLLDALGGLQPWQATFVAVGLPGIVVSIIFWFLHEPARQERKFDRSGAVSLLDTTRFLFSHSRIYITIIVGAAVSALASYGMYAWVPTLFLRKYGWASGETGVTFGLITLVFGTGGLVASGAIAGWMNRNGDRAAQLKILIYSLIGATCAAPFIIAISSPYWTFACLAVVIFFLGTPIGLTPAALQAITPNEMRAQIVAIYIAVVGIIGLGLGSWTVASVTQYIFKSDAAVGMSLAIVMSLAAGLSVVILWLGLDAFRVRVTDYEGGTETVPPMVEAAIEPQF